MRQPWTARLAGSALIVAFTAGMLFLVGIAAAALSGTQAREPAAPGAAQQYEPAKRIICHHARVVRRIRGVRFRVVKHVSISVRVSFVRAHRRHGDTLGRCTTAANKRAHKAKAHVRRWHKPIRIRG